MADGKLQEWLANLKAGETEVIDFKFPSDQIKMEYLSTIDARNDVEVRSLLRHFLLQSCSLGCDNFYLRSQIALAKQGQRVNQSEYMHRLVGYAKSRRRSPPPWEGITWVLDLLPYWPRAAIQVIDAYFQAHAQCLPDGRLHGLYDAMAVIRAWCIESPRTSEEALRLLKEEPPRTLEHLVERLYKSMGYSTVLTPRQNDGGYDVLATKRKGTVRIRAHIECKRWGETVGRPIMQKLLGVVSDMKATNGICVTTGRFTRPARQFADNNHRLDCVDGRMLIERLNEHLGSRWYLSLDRLVAESIKEASAHATTAVIG